jgi:hypothetical protein
VLGDGTDKQLPQPAAAPGTEKKAIGLELFDGGKDLL